MTTQPTDQTPANNPAAMFNEFMTQAVRHGSLSVEHRRVRNRQPENEAFIRKALVALRKLAPSTRTDVSSVEIPGSRTVAGPIGLAEAAAQYLAAQPGLKRFLGEPDAARAAAKAPPTGHGLANEELFAVLHAYAFSEVSKELGAGSAFGSSAATVATRMAGADSSIKPRVREAADSVFARSFADAHAISLCAAFYGTEFAAVMLNDVVRRRTAGGDLEAYSLSRLSHDTRATLEILRSQLTLGAKNFTAMTRQQLWANSLWLAAEGLGIWMEHHGAATRTAVGVSHALETAAHIVAAVSQNIRRQSLGTALAV